MKSTPRMLDYIRRAAGGVHEKGRRSARAFFGKLKTRKNEKSIGQMPGKNPHPQPADGRATGVTAGLSEKKCKEENRPRGKGRAARAIEVASVVVYFAGVPVLAASVFAGAAGVTDFAAGATDGLVEAATVWTGLVKCFFFAWTILWLVVCASPEICLSVVLAAALGAAVAGATGLVASAATAGSARARMPATAAARERRESLVLMMLGSRWVRRLGSETRQDNAAIADVSPRRRDGLVAAESRQG
jgi:hypothetical protein